ncbi:outer membrane protein [Microvirga sp. M2]|uniref:outer membrane protein n=1 Tax=Microvirga sp. M2 TaxID=3073270 RepID=UPI0039C32D7B
MNVIRIVAVTGLYAATGSAALAADLPQAFWAPTPVLRETREAALGWYLRGDVGYVDYKRPEADFAIQPFTAGFTHETMGNAAVIAAGVGYRFNPNVRMDLTLDHVFDARFKGVAPAPTLATASITDRAAFQTSTVMVNGYLDFRPVLGFTPYVGAGIGVAHNVLSRHMLTTYDAATGDEVSEYLAGGDTYNFAWALMAGLGYQMSSNFTLDLGYRYVSLGDVKTRTYGDGTGVDVGSIGAHEVRMGVRYNFR